MLHSQVTIIGPKQRYIWREDKVLSRRAEVQSSLYDLCLAFTSSFYVTQVGRTIETDLESVATYLLNRLPLVRAKFTPFW